MLGRTKRSRAHARVMCTRKSHAECHFFTHCHFFARNDTPHAIGWIGKFDMHPVGFFSKECGKRDLEKYIVD